MSDNEDPDDAAGDEDGTRFASLSEWLHEWLLSTWQHRCDQSQVWCPQWWRHPEAVSRLEAMWRSWEALRLDGPVGMATWWRDIADYQMSRLLEGTGPFASCRDGHRADDELFLTAQPAPPGWFDGDEDTDHEVPDWGLTA